MLLTALGFGLTMTVLAAAGYGTGRYAAQLGSMSGQWMAAHQASQPASSN